MAWTNTYTNNVSLYNDYLNDYAEYIVHDNTKSLYWDNNTITTAPDVWQEFCQWLGIDQDTDLGDLRAMCEEYPALKTKLDQFAELYALTVDEWRRKNRD